ncbi:MAG: hypothetical protein ACI9GJ_001398 [Parasphingorhabdus sp.]
MSLIGPYCMVDCYKLLDIFPTVKNSSPRSVLKHTTNKA